MDMLISLVSCLIWSMSSAWASSAMETDHMTITCHSDDQMHTLLCNVDDAANGFLEAVGSCHECLTLFGCGDCDVDWMLSTSLASFSCNTTHFWTNESLSKSDAVILLSMSANTELRKFFTTPPRILREGGRRGRW